MKKRRSTARPSTSSSPNAKKTQKSPQSLKNKSLILGVSGGIAAYKTVELLRRLTGEGASVTVMMTEAARRFITPLSLEAVSGRPVLCSLYDEPLSHVSLPASADALIVAPATANIIGKFANGIADDLLSTSFLAFQGPVVLAPSMNWRMYGHGATRRNLETLRQYGVRMVGPVSGPLACGEDGPGRMAEVSDIVAAVRTALAEQDFRDRTIVVTAGPTREYLDPVRFISNRSSGRMGFALARAAAERGGRVTLITGPTGLTAPANVDVVGVETAEEMMNAVQKAMRQGPHVFIMAAAVADYRPRTKTSKKHEKKKELTLPLTRTPDIISWVATRPKRPFVVGFAAETGPDIRRAEEKMARKKMDMIVFNDVSDPQAGFDVETNRVTIIDKKGRTRTGVLPKQEVASVILDRIKDRIKQVRA